MPKKINKSIIQKAFRFSRATCDNLRELVTLGIVRNETEAIDLAVMHFLIEKKTEARFKDERARDVQLTQGIGLLTSPKIFG